MNELHWSLILQLVLYAGLAYLMILTERLSNRTKKNSESLYREVNDMKGVFINMRTDIYGMMEKMSEHNSKVKKGIEKDALKSMKNYEDAYINDDGCLIYQQVTNSTKEEWLIFFDKAREFCSDFTLNIFRKCSKDQYDKQWDYLKERSYSDYFPTIAGGLPVMLRIEIYEMETSFHIGVLKSAETMMREVELEKFDFDDEKRFNYYKLITMRIGSNCLTQYYPKESELRIEKNKVVKNG